MASIPPEPGDSTRFHGAIERTGFCNGRTHCPKPGFKPGSLEVFLPNADLMYMCMFFSPHNFLRMTRESLSPSSGPCEEARKCSRVGEAPSTTARRQQIRLSGPEVWACVMLPRNQRQPSSKPQKAEPVTEGESQAPSVPQRLGPARSKEKSASKSPQ